MRPGNLEGLDHWAFGDFGKHRRGRGRGRGRGYGPPAWAKAKAFGPGMARTRKEERRTRRKKRFQKKMGRRLTRPGVDKAMLIQRKIDRLQRRRRCGLYCQWRLRWLQGQLPPVIAPVAPPRSAVANAVAKAGAVVGVDPTATDPGVSGYFGSWIYF